MGSNYNFKNFTLCSINVCGWRNKGSLIKNLIATHRIDILCVTELKSAATPRLSGFTTFFRPASGVGGRSCGGAAVFVRNCLPSVRLNFPSSLSDEQLAGAVVATPVGLWSVICLYNNPRHSLNIDIFEYAASLDNCIIAGDFNARSVALGDSKNNNNGDNLDYILNIFPLVHINNNLPTCITYNGASIPDHILISDNLTTYFFPSAYIGTTVTSDHLPLVVDAVWPGAGRKSFKRIVTAFGRADWASFEQQIENAVQNIRTEPATTETLNRAVDEFTGIIQRAVSDCIPTITLTIKPERPPLPSSIVALIREKRRLYRQFLVARDPQLKTDWNRLNARIRLSIRAFKEREWCDACAELDYRNGSAFWRKFNALTGKYNRDPIAITRDGLPILDDETKANEFANLLRVIHTTNEDPSFCEPHRIAIENAVHKFKLENCHASTPPPAPFDPSEVAALLGAPKSSAPGPDMITWRILSHLPPSAIDLITQIYNLCLTTTHFPSSWKKASVIMIPKPGKDVTKTSNYRPISLLNTLGKCYEKLLKERLLSHCEEHDIVPAYQAGFRARHSTTDLALRLHCSIADSFNRNHCTLAAMLDVERAFDTVWHAALIYKLIAYGFPAYIINIVCSYLTGRCSRVKIRNAYSKEFPLDAGLPQGAVLSPLLYIIFTADTPRSSNVQLGLYADDTCYWTPARNAEAAARSLQDALNAFSAWARMWRIKVNSTKTQTILFRHAARSRSRLFNPRNAGVKLGGSWVFPSPTADYLGIRFDATLSWKPETVRTLKQLRSRSVLLSRLRKGIKGCSTRTLLFTYRTFVRPIAEYRWPGFISSTNVLKKLAGAERRLLRLITRAPFQQHPALTYAACNLQDNTIMHRFARRGARYIGRLAEDRPGFLADLESVPANSRKNKVPRKVREHPHPHPLDSLRSLLLAIDAGETPWMPQRAYDPG